MVDQAREEQKQNVIRRLGRIREEYHRCLADVSADAGTNGTEWSITDLLRHTSAGYYRRMLTSILEEDNPDIAGEGYDPEAEWKRIVDRILSEIDGAIVTASGLDANQLARSGKRSGKTIEVLDVLTFTADHFDEHLVQLRDEIRPREGLPNT